MTQPAKKAPSIKLLFSALLLVMLLSALDQTIVSTALPTIVDRVFVTEIAIDLSDAEPGFAGDLRHAGSVKSTGAKAAARGGDDFVLP